MSDSRTTFTDAWDLPGTVMPNGWTRRVLFRDEAHEPVEGTSLLVVPAGHVGTYARPGELEWHNSHEEITVVKGGLDFGGYYPGFAVSYMCHPETWVHPSDHHYAQTVDTVLLLKTYGRTDFFNCPVPENWDRREWFAEEDPDGRRAEGISAIAAADLPWGPLLVDGRDTGAQAVRVAHRPRNEVTTWFFRAPAGWYGQGPVRTAPGQHELFVLSGDLQVLAPDGATGGGPGSYWQSREEVRWEGEALHSREGCLAIAWTRLPVWLEIPSRVRAGRPAGSPA